jgi:hypothetical protein
MASIKIKDLPKDMKITETELKRIKGGLFDVFYPSNFMPVDYLKHGQSALSIARFRKV